MNKFNGFTLIELIVVTVIVAILALIALPSYNQYMRESRRIDAKNALVAVQLAEEKYRGNNTSYTVDLTATGLNLGTASPQGYYTISISAATATNYTATATVNSTSSQSSDSVSCPTLSVNQGGFVIDAYASCWGL